MPEHLSAYDSVPYPSRAFAQTHPDRLAVVGTLLGMSPAPVERCRVLELACGDGSNLIPMAYGLPDSEFRGVDLAAKPVQAANAMIRSVSLQNIRIEQRDLLEIDKSFGEFDYIIAHGVYAWVPEHVQEKILAICGANLATSGIAFVSYNTTPAGQIRRMLREMVQFHATQAPKTSDKVAHGRQVVEALLTAAEEGSAWKALLKEEFHVTFDRDARVIFHDDLGDCFAPVSFLEFSQRAKRAGLQVLGDAKLKSLVAPGVSADGSDSLRQLAGDDPVAYEHYLDFTTYRRFRQTLLCHAGVALNRSAMPQQAKKLFVASPLRAPAEQPDGAVEFANTRGPGTIQTNNPHLVAVLKALEKIWPRGERLTKLLDGAESNVSLADGNEIADGLVRSLMTLAASKLVDLRVHQFSVADGVSEKPVASLLARKQMEQGSLVTTLLHTHVNLEDEQGRKFLQLLDGTRSHQDLAGALTQEEPQAGRAERLHQVADNLDRLHRIGLLIS